MQLTSRKHVNTYLIEASKTIVLSQCTFYAGTQAFEDTHIPQLFHVPTPSSAYHP